MNIAKVSIYQYKLPFNELVRVKNKELDTREGLIIRILTDDGLEGLGEISPLPGLYPYTLSEVLDQLKNLLPFLSGSSLSSCSNSKGKYLPKNISDMDLFSSVRFGLEMAFLNLASLANNTNLGNLITSDCLEEVKIHGLLQGDVQTVTKLAKELMTKGFVSFKIKGTEDIDSDIKKLTALAKATNNKALFHLDCNQKWNLPDALKLCDQLQKTPLLYIEEPFKNINEVPEFYQLAMIPIALDETLLTEDFERLKSLDGFEYLIIKPQLVGGIEKTLDLVGRCQALAVAPVISSSFESELGIQTLVQIAGAINTGQSCGLDTLKYFKESILKEGNTISQATINLKERPISFDRLEKENLEECFVC